MLLDKRLSDIVEKKLEKCQMLFCLNRCAVNSIFIISHIFEKCYEQTIVFNFCFSMHHYIWVY